MLMLSALLAIGQAAPPPVPGLCSEPVPANAETPGCYNTNTLDLAGAPSSLFWQIYEFASVEAAETEARLHRWAAVTTAHSRVWLYLLSDTGQTIDGIDARAVIGPLVLPNGPATAHFAEAIFPPGMRTRVHSHPGPEAFFVVDGEQCMESPTDRAILTAGQSYVVAAGPHLQAAPRGRRNLVLIIAPKDEPFVVPAGGDWRPSSFCDG